MTDSPPAPPPLVIIGAPSSAGAYAPGQEKAPGAWRQAGLVEALRQSGIDAHDAGDVPGFRWCADRVNPRAMNWEAALHVASAVAPIVRQAVEAQAKVLVLGGDCTVELGTVAGVLAAGGNPGLAYFDLDTDLNTPESTTDGALDWMGVAHMLALPGTVPALTRLAGSAPMLAPRQVAFMGSGNVEPFEREVISSMAIVEHSVSDVAADPRAVGLAVANEWARDFDQLLIHLDMDVLDFLDMPLAENTRRNIGLTFAQMMAALDPLLAAPNWTTLTICELNPDHGAADGATLRTFVDALTQSLRHALVDS